ncbi:FadR family transcriptional regulator [bacterium LRH843]|nr:FadR family transcriptional regulator [bacterium LRH843]
MNSIKKIKKKRIYEEVISELESLIKRGVYKVGDKLPSEEELSKAFSVSKSAVREAMSVLKSSGIIQVKQGIGTFLSEAPGSSAVTNITSMLLLSEFPLIEVFELRRALEVEAVSLAVLRGTDEDIQKLTETNEAMLSAIKKGMTAAEEDYEFHRLLFLATHNSVFIKVFNSISEILKEGIAATKSQKAHPERNFEGVEEHRNIIKAIEKKDSTAARRAMRLHLYNNETKTWKTKPNYILDER